MFDAMRVRWAEYVVEYNIRDQAKALRGFAAWFKSFRGKDQNAQKDPSLEKDEAEDKIESFSFRFDWRWFASIMAAFVVAVLGVRWWQKRRRRTRAGTSLDPDKDRAVRLYLTLEESLRRAGHPRSPDVTPQEHADALDEVGFAAAEDVHQVTDAYLATRFGDQALNPQDYQRLRRVSQKLHRKPERPGA